MKGTKSLGALNASQQISTRGATEAKIALTGTFVATVVAEYSEDGGTTWNTAPLLKTDGTIVQSVNAVVTVRVVHLPAKNVLLRTRVSAYTSGAVSVAITA